MKILGLVVCSTLILAAHAATASTTFCNTASIATSAGGATSGSGDPYPSTISVAGMGTISTVNVQLRSLSHSWPSDVDLLLVGPTGAKLVIQSDVGGGYFVSGLNYVISDSGATLLPDGVQLVAGTFKPTNYGSGDPFAAPAPAGPYSEAAPAGTATLTSVFAGTNPNGQWKLFVTDDSVGDTGAFAGGWCLDVANAAVTLQTDETVRSYWPRMTDRIFRNGVPATCATP